MRTKRKWGYSGQVGKWSGSLAISPALRRPPLAAAQWLLEQVIPIFKCMHRPRRMRVSWAECDEQLREIAYHELDEIDVTSWDSIGAHLSRLEVESGAVLVLSFLFVALDTAVIEDEKESWAEESAELQISMPPEYTDPDSAIVSYTTWIDVWLSKTLDEAGAVRANAAAAANLPRLEALLRDFAALAGDTYCVEESQTYYDFITETGFRNQVD